VATFIALGAFRDSSMAKRRNKTVAAGPNTHANDPGLTPAEIRAAEKLIERALGPRAVPHYTSEERFALAVMAANYSKMQRARGAKSKGAAKDQAARRRGHVNLLLRHVVEERYRRKPATSATVMRIIDWLDQIGIEASEPQVRRDVKEALKQGPLPTG
jgi:hypothetical protein